jgi:pyridoxine 5'-phosphate synthase PdxJ
MTDDLNEESLTQAMLKLKMHTEPLKPLLHPTYMLVPRATVQEVADEKGITFEEAKAYLHDIAEKLKDAIHD